MGMGGCGGWHGVGEAAAAGESLIQIRANISSLIDFTSFVKIVSIWFSMFTSLSSLFALAVHIFSDERFFCSLLGNLSLQSTHNF